MKKILYIALGAAMLSGCSKEQGNEPVGDNLEVQLTSNIATRAVGTTWEAGDKIGVFHSTDANIPYMTATGDGVFTCTLADGKKIYYKAGAKSDITAYYPWQGDVSFGSQKISNGFCRIEVETQTAPAAIDLMTAKLTSVTPSSNPQELTFHRQLAKISLTLQSGIGSPNISGFSGAVIKGMVSKAVCEISKVTNGSSTTPLSYNFNNNEGSLKVYKNDITMRKTGATTVEAIIIPQTLTAGASTIVFAMDGVNYMVEFANVTFEPGRNYQYTIKVNANTGVIIFYLSAPNITPWTASNGSGEDGTARPE